MACLNNTYTEAFSHTSLWKTEWKFMMGWSSFRIGLAITPRLGIPVLLG